MLKQNEYIYSRAAPFDKVTERTKAHDPHASHDHAQNERTNQERNFNKKQTGASDAAAQGEIGDAMPEGKIIR